MTTSKGQTLTRRQTHEAENDNDDHNDDVDLVSTRVVAIKHWLLMAVCRKPHDLQACDKYLKANAIRDTDTFQMPLGGESQRRSNLSPYRLNVAGGSHKIE